jgi:hypothetical protein
MLINSIGFGLFRSLGTNINVNRPKRGPVKIRKRQQVAEILNFASNIYFLLNNGTCKIKILYVLHVSKALNHLPLAPPSVAR